MKRLQKQDDGVSEIVGTILLLGFAIALFVLVQIMALNFPFNEPDPSVRISAVIDMDSTAPNNDIVILVHQGGESLSLDTKTIFVIQDGAPYTTTAGAIIDPDTSNGDDSWNIGEKLLYGPYNLAGKEVRITVVDVVTNSVIMQGTVRG